MGTDRPSTAELLNVLEVVADSLAQLSVAFSGDALVHKAGNPFDKGGHAFIASEFARRMLRRFGR